MNRDEFESKILELWVKSRVPLTHANLQYFAGVPRKKLNAWIDELLDDGLLDIDVDDAGELTYLVPGSNRSVDGPSSCEAYERKREMVEEAKRRILARRSGQPIEEDKSEPKKRKQKKEKEKKREIQTRHQQSSDDDDDDDDDGPGVLRVVSKVALMAGGKAMIALDKPLSMMDKPVAKGDKNLLISAGLSLFGPLGWLYAGSFREAIPATMAYVAVGAILPTFILAPFMLVGSVASAAVGLTYAWQFNRKKRRTTLFLSSKNKKKRNDDDDE